MCCLAMNGVLSCLTVAWDVLVVFVSFLNDIIPQKAVTFGPFYASGRDAQKSSHFARISALGALRVLAAHPIGFF